MTDMMDTSRAGEAQNPNRNLMALLSYVLGFISGIVMLLIEKKDEFIRFHAMQSTVLFGGIFIAQIVLGFVPIIGPLVSMILGLATLALWIVLMIKAFQGERFVLPVVGEFAEKQLNK